MQKLMPSIIEEKHPQTLEQVPQKEYTEDYIQTIVFNNPALLQLNEIDTSCGRIAPLCRELSIGSGYIDDIFVDDNGILTIVECKLIRNHQATREVVGQILDYAKEIVKLTYKQFESIVQKILKTSKQLSDIVSEHITDLDSELFEYNLSKNLKEGRMNLVIAGDRISRNVEELVSFLNSYSKMSFRLGVVEIQLYKMPEPDKRIIAIPNCLFKTVEYYLYRLDDTKEEVKILPNSIEMFYEKLQKSTGISKNVKDFIDEICNTYHLITTLGRGKCISLNVKTEDEENNLLSISDDGILSFYGLTYNGLPDNRRKSGKTYVESVCKLVGAEPNYIKGNEWSAHPKKDGSKLSIKEMMNSTKKWTEYIQAFLSDYDNYLSELH